MNQPPGGRSMTTTQTTRLSGCARRRAKAVARRRLVHQIENDIQVAAGRLPLNWVALDTCPCGRVAWLEEGADNEDHDGFSRDSEDHASYCDGGAA